MDRIQRVAPPVSSGRLPWMRALAVALALAGLGIALGSAAPTPALAQASGKSMSVPLAPNAPETYVVKKGDTLWDISGVFLKYPWYWPEIWYVNPQIENPHLIYPGDVLRLVYVDGKPRVTLDRAGDVRLSPEVRSEPLAQAIRTVPYDVLMNFVQRPSLLTRDQVRNAPHVLSFRGRHLVGSAQNELYARDLGTPAPGTRYSIVHPERELRDPDDGDLLGYVGLWGGTADVITTTDTSKLSGGITHLTVVDTGRAIMAGDKLLPYVADFGEDLQISAPANLKLNGQVLAVPNYVAVAGKFQVLAINRGKRDGLAPGNAVAIFRRGEMVRDRFSGALDWHRFTATYDTVQLPKERSGTLLLFTVYDRMSYGIIVESTQPIYVGDFIKHPDFGHSDTGLSDYYR